MPKIRLNTTIDESLMKLVKEIVSNDELKNINVLIEKALKFYFANLSLSVWEAKCAGGWTRKLIIRPDAIIIENIRSRKIFKKYDRTYYADDAMLQKDGWTRVWKMKKDEKGDSQ